MKKRNCYGTYGCKGFACLSYICSFRQDCGDLTATLSRITKVSTAGLATYLTDDEELIRKAAKKRFDELAGVSK